MPIRQTLMDELVKRYGAEKGKTVYYAMEAEGKGPFGPKGKYRGDHESFAKRNSVPPIKAKGTKKPRRKVRRGVR